ncbi:MAG TPA: phosphoribosylanthranilate isomerase [Patescibacteria group bacterium]|nr:phosphoribosylanthranilate isomerase [Patescibacteria group bacterium]
MKQVKVKICGVQTIDAARVVVSAGADYLGLIFVPTSKRFISPDQAKKIISEVKNDITIVGVFQGEELEKVLKLREELRFDYVQLHGDENRDYIKQLGGNIIKARRVTAEDSSDAIITSLMQFKTEFALVDRDQGESDTLASVTIAPVARRLRFFFAGGLTPENVAEKVREVKPYAVDVSSGVETIGQKDRNKIEKFIRLAKEATYVA